MTERRRGLLLLGLAIIAISCAAPLVRAAQPAPAMSVASLRIAVAALILCLLGGRPAWRAIARLSTVERARLLLSGVLLGAHFGVWIASLYFTSTAASVALVATNPIFAALLGRLLSDHVSRREWIGIAVAASGCVLLAGGDFRAGGDALFGDLLAIAGAALAAGNLVLGRSLRNKLPLLPYLAAINVVAAATLLAVAIVVGAPLFSLSGTSYAAIVAAAVIASLGGHTLLNAAVRRAPTHLVSLAILGEPIGASLLTWAFFAEVPPLTAVAGGAVVLVGIALGFSGPSPTERHRE